ncbi:MAG: aldehyde ferredoxin oxidoreductase family protein [Thermodesulfobacteriota bacterium]
MRGFYGRILDVNLTDRTFRIEPLPDEFLSAGLGGKGLATGLLLERNPAGVDPLAPENHLILATGPFCGTSLWGGCRYGVFTKSPLTGLYSESYSGGRTPEAIDSAGFDAVVIRGRAERPTAMAVHPEGCEFFDAGEIWGADTYKTEDEAKARFAPNKPGYGKSGAVVIGPAGENLVRFAVIENDYWRSAGRTGVGAVMGSKKLKAIVFQGDRQRRMHDPEGLKAYAREFLKTFKDNPATKAYNSRGTTMMVAVLNMAQGFPTRYWSEGVFDRWERISGDTLHKEHRVQPHACLKCFIACGRRAVIDQGRHKGLTIEGPEYETIYAFGGLCLIDDLGEIAHLNDLCDRLGLDTITAGNLCGLAIEAARRGRIDYRIDYGDAEAIAGLIEAIAARKGLGDVLAQGIVPAARAWDLSDLAVHVKGLEPAGYDPRVFKGMGLAYASSDRGACHLRTTFYKAELAGMIPREAIEGKARLFIEFEDRLNIFDSLILCRFFRDFYTWDELLKALTLVTGMNLNEADLRQKAVYIANLTRRFNLREGLRPEQDRLPPRLHREALPTGQALTVEELEYMLADYYRLRGWDEAGVPPAE